MNIAITLSGRCDYHNEQNSNIVSDVRRLYLDNFIQKYNADVHAHTWINSKKENILSIENIENLKTLQMCDENDALIEYEEFLNLKANERQPDTDGFQKFKIKNLLKMTYGMKKSIEQIENYEIQNNKKYDIIIRLRYDNFIIETNFLKYKLVVGMPDNYIINSSKFMLYFDSLPIGQGRTVLLSNDYSSYCLRNDIICEYQKGKVWINDQFFYGNKSSRDLHKLYDYLPYFFQNYDACNQAGLPKNQICPEKIMGYFCYDKKINVVNQSIINGLYRKPYERNEIVDSIDSVYISNKRELDRVLNFENI